MRYTVTWHRDAQKELAETWLRASDRTSITQAVVEGLLAESPGTVGEEFYGDRLLVVPPVAATYSIRSEDRIVEVLESGTDE
jgi:hypothetical protein